jgi:hypothetical protein
MIRAAAFALLCVLAGCGADGAPEPLRTGMTLTGDAQIGVTSRR